MVDIEYIRKLRLRDGLSIREIARRVHHSRTTVARYLGREEVEPRYQRARAVEQPAQDRIRPIVQEWLRADESAPRKQRHTA